ncbi:hypothetical protein F511_34294 [Dorcoceras hygrometricum]|uniref:Uncharacterized protein n=1 Tax=Dorcoceras hygrometricum TaxID=472368 RepID=A0A2Z7A648_9LAMI|nr:hypothetical protein F511_34294 [Dorcoceras hygrometricum]
MPFPLKVQPIDWNTLPERQVPANFEPLKPAVKSRFKRLFERQFSSVLKISTQDKPPGADEPPNHCSKDVADEFEPSSVCLAKMVQNFIEESNEKPKCGRNLCNCFNGNCSDGFDDEHDLYPMDACDILKGLVPSVCVSERNLLADTTRIVEKNKISKRKDGFCRKILTDGLAALGYNASICNSKWGKTASFPAGEYEYVDVVIESERFLIDIDFRAEFEIARSTKAYKLVLQALPNIFVGKVDRLEKIIEIVSESARQSLNKKGMPFPPWRKADYVKSKWLSPHTRHSMKNDAGKKEEELVEKASSRDENESILADKSSAAAPETNGGDDEKKSATPTVVQWEPPEIKPKTLHGGGKIVAGLASIIQDKE